MKFTERKVLKQNRKELRSHTDSYSCDSFSCNMLTLHPLPSRDRWLLLFVFLPKEGENCSMHCIYPFPKIATGHRKKLDIPFLPAREETTIFGIGPRRADHRLHILPHSGRVTTSLPVAKWGQGQLINQLCLCNNNKTTLSWHPVDGEMMPRTACRALFDIGWVRVACLSVMSLHSQRMSLWRR